MREFLKSLDLEKEVIEKIMAEVGKEKTSDKNIIETLKNEKNELETKVKDYETKITELNSKAEDNSKIQKELDDLKKNIAEENEKKQKAEKDKQLTANILNAIGDKKFVNDYTKNSIVSEIKTAYSDEKNVGKSFTDLFNEITKDKEGLFENPNKPADMIGSNQDIFNKVDKDAFDKMGYKERVNLKAENPELFEKLNNSKE